MGAAEKWWTWNCRPNNRMWDCRTKDLGRLVLTDCITMRCAVAQVFCCRGGSHGQYCFPQFLRATAGTAIARLSHRNSVRPSVRPSVTRVDQAKTVQARIIKSSPSAAPKTLVSGSATLFPKFHRGHPSSILLRELYQDANWTNHDSLLCAFSSSGLQ